MVALVLCLAVGVCDVCGGVVFAFVVFVVCIGL